MQTTTPRIALLCAAVLAAPLLSLHAHASLAADLSGQYVGNSQIDGEKSVAKTMLMIGGADAENTTLRIEGENTCTLKNGHYAADGDAWSLSFKDANGGDSCKRMAEGKFTLHAGAKPRTLEFEAAFSSAGGGQSLRRGALHRYP